MPGGIGGMGGGGGDPQLAKTVQTWFIIAIASLFCGCGCFGLIPVYLMYTAKQDLASGNVTGARNKLKYTKICVIVGVVMMVLGMIGYAATIALAMLNS